LYELKIFFPDVWAEFAGHLPADQRGDLLNNYYRLLTDPDPAIHLPAAIAWSRYEGMCSTLLPRPETGHQRFRRARFRWL